MNLNSLLKLFGLSLEYDEHLDQYSITDINSAREKLLNYKSARAILDTYQDDTQQLVAVPKRSFHELFSGFIDNFFEGIGRPLKPFELTEYNNLTAGQFPTDSIERLRDFYKITKDENRFAIIDNIFKQVLELFKTGKETQIFIADSKITRPRNTQFPLTITTDHPTKDQTLDAFDGGRYIPINRIITSQTIVSATKVINQMVRILNRAWPQKGEHLSITRDYNGQTNLDDGHHRAIAALLTGATHVYVQRKHFSTAGPKHSIIDVEFIDDVTYTDILNSNAAIALAAPMSMAGPFLPMYQ